MQTSFYSNGKLLLTGEYAVLDGAMGLAIPTKKGQSLTLAPADGEALLWNSFDENGQCWFNATFSLKNLNSITTNHLKIAETLARILQATRQLNPNFLKNTNGIEASTALGFPRDWGLGSSSTLINNIAQWGGVDAFTLLQNSFGGSGYDVAAAKHSKPIFYSLKNGIPTIQELSLPWDFTDALFFIHLNQKQNSKEGISDYNKKRASVEQLQKITDLSKKLLLCYTLNDFEALMNAHERVISEVIGRPTIKEALFPTFKGTIKSLGAWGGDFVLATGTPEEMEYFKRKNFTTIIPFSEMIL